MVCAIQLVLALGYIFQAPFAIQLWPLPYSNPTTYLFIGSIYAAAVASTLWCLWSREDGAIAGVALDYVAIFLPVGIFVLQISGGRMAQVTFAMVAMAGALFGLALVAWSIRLPIRDPRPMPRLVRWSFGVFVIALVIVGGQMVLKMPNVLPWNVNTVGQVIYGWMFIGAAAYFAYGVLRPSWHNAAGQLAGFLAYDVVLIIPFLLLLPTIDADKLPNLIIYLTVLIYSGLLAIYYLFINPQTRMINRTA
ncbi:MAG: hypothetical protein SF123_13165 [Chloroflexota bacterium]|nr:hypothetical protein [Chloroflexota bacterium]